MDVSKTKTVMEDVQIKSSRTTVFSSNSQLDVIQIKEFGYWEHACNPLGAEVGDIVVVMPNDKQRKIYNEDTTVAVGIISSIDFDITSQANWASNRFGNNKKYKSRIGIEDIELKKLSDIKYWIMNKKMGNRGIMYI